MSFTKAFGENSMKITLTEQAHPRVALFMWSLPAGKTCPAAGECLKYCYAQTGRMKLDQATTAYGENYTLWEDGVLEPVLYGDLILKSYKARKDGMELCIRLHDTGDFFCLDYARMWFSIMDRLPDVRFYAYSKSVRILETVKAERGGFPENFHLVYSKGGREDYLIPEDARVAVVIGKNAELPEDFIDGSHDDWYAMHDEYRRIALRAHGPHADKVE